MFIKKAMSRRQLLSNLGGAGAVTALSPFIPLLESANAQSGSLKRFAYWHEFVMPEKRIVDENYQAATGPLQFRNAYAPLNAIQNKIIFLRQMSRKQGEIRGQGPHPFGAQGITGWRGDKKEEYNVRGTSIDQFFAQQLSGQTAFADIRAGFRNSGNQGEIDTSSSVIKGVPQPRYQNPLALYNDVFKDFQGGGSAGSQPSDLLARRKSVLDFMYKDLQRIEARVSHFDRNKIEAHETAIRETEQKLESLLGSGGGQTTASCKKPESPGALAVRENLIYPVYADLVTMALACNLTRVAGMCYGSSTSNLEYAFLKEYSGRGSWHGATHGNDNNATYVRAVLKFRAEQVSNFLQKMDSIIEPDGNTLLDNTIFSWFTDVARDHNTSDDIHCVLAGGKGRFKQQGQMTNVGNGNTYNQLLGSMAHFMGFEVDGYGDPNYGGKGVLSNTLFS